MGQQRADRCTQLYVRFFFLFVELCWTRGRELCRLVTRSARDLRRAIFSRKSTVSDFRYGAEYVATYDAMDRRCAPSRGAKQSNGGQVRRRKYISNLLERSLRNHVDYVHYAQLLIVFLESMICAVRVESLYECIR